MEKALNLAMKAGYKPEKINYNIKWSEEGDSAESTFQVDKNKCALDPLFWQSLGRSLGWARDLGKNRPSNVGWLFYWHSFIDYLAQGKTAEDFFKELLIN